MATLTCERARIAQPGGPLPDELTFESDAERLGLVGDWSFLGRLLLREATLQGGHVAFMEESATEALRKGVVGLAPKDVPLPNEWNVESYLRRGSELSGQPARASRRLAAKALDTLGIAHLSGRKLRALELPERRALSLAQALLSSPPVIIADRPFDDLHDGAAEWLRAILERAALQRRLILCAGSAVPLGESDRYLRTLGEIAVLSRGRVVHRGAPPAVLAPGTRYLVTVGGSPDALIDALRARDVAVEWPRRSNDAVVRYHQLVVHLPEGATTDLLLGAAVSLDVSLVEMVPLFGPQG